MFILFYIALSSVLVPRYTTTSIYPITESIQIEIPEVHFLYGHLSYIIKSLARLQGSVWTVWIVKPIYIHKILALIIISI